MCHFGNVFMLFFLDISLVHALCNSGTSWFPAVLTQRSFMPNLVNFHEKKKILNKIGNMQSQPDYKTDKVFTDICKLNTFRSVNRASWKNCYDLFDLRLIRKFLKTFRKGCMGCKCAELLLSSVLNPYSHLDPNFPQQILIQRCSFSLGFSNKFYNNFNESLKILT